jgi:hypothetical protein
MTADRQTETSDFRSSKLPQSHASNRLTMFSVVNGSHSFGLIICSGKSAVSNGNTINPINEHVINGAAIGQTVGSRHKYQEIVISDDAKVHNGNIGIGKSEGHDFQRIEVRGGKVKNGDFDDVATMEKEMG